MIVPFWSWNLSDTTHVRSHTKFQLIWAINTAFTRGGLNQPPPSLKCVAGTPSLLGLILQSAHVLWSSQLLTVLKLEREYSDFRIEQKHVNVVCLLSSNKFLLLADIKISNEYQMNGLNGSKHSNLNIQNIKLFFYPQFAGTCW